MWKKHSAVLLCFGLTVAVKGIELNNELSESARDGCCQERYNCCPHGYRCDLKLSNCVRGHGGVYPPLDRYPTGFRGPGPHSEPDPVLTLSHSPITNPDQSVVSTYPRHTEKGEEEEDRKVAFVLCCNLCLIILMIILLSLLLIRYKYETEKHTYQPSVGPGITNPTPVSKNASDSGNQTQTTPGVSSASSSTSSAVTSPAAITSPNTPNRAGGVPIPRYEDQSRDTWNDFDIKVESRVKFAIRRFPHARWFVGMWGSTYVRIMTVNFNPQYLRSALHSVLRSPFGQGLSMDNFTGFAIINTPIRNDRVRIAVQDTQKVFRDTDFGDPALKPEWFYIHTAGIWPGIPNDEVIKNVFWKADLVGISTSNSSDESNQLLKSHPDCLYKAASYPNPIRQSNKEVRGMLDILQEFPNWKTRLNQTRLCFSVTTAINYAWSNVAKIDFVGEIGGQPEDVQRYTRKRFGKKTASKYPVQEKDLTYSFDNVSQTHVWRWLNYKGDLARFMAYDTPDTLSMKMNELLDAYPDDKCVVFDDLGDDSTKLNANIDGTQVDFEPHTMLKAVVEAMTARYGPAFPAIYY